MNWTHAACALFLLVGGHSAANAATETVVYSFKGGTDGSAPHGGLIYMRGALYGTTTAGGASGFGTVFKVRPDGKESVIYSFKGGLDGSAPSSELLDVGGILYGTTQLGGKCNDGTVFKLIPGGIETVVYAFAPCDGPDGQYPAGGLINIAGVLYGVTGGGGSSSSCDRGTGGTVYSVTTAGTLTYLHSFGCGADGSFPIGRLLKVGGAVYGATVFGGLGCGTLFKLQLPDDESVLYSFEGGSDGCHPEAGITELNHVLFGTTSIGGVDDGGGTTDGGIVFAASLAGTETVLHSFSNSEFRNGDGFYPYAPLTDLDGTLYGTTTGGITARGTVFSITPGGVEAVVHNFTGTPDGSIPYAGLTRVGNTLYGTTAGGGADGFGAVFMVTP